MNKAIALLLVAGGAILLYVGVKGSYQTFFGALALQPTAPSAK